MHLAFVMTGEPGFTDRLLEEFAERLQNRGQRLAGLVQTNPTHPGAHRCDMDVRVLPDGPVVRISQSLGEHATGCRLDPAALEEAIYHARDVLATGADLLIVNKFGKHEAKGRGCRDLIAEAMAMDVPVITGLNELNRAAFVEFSDGIAEQLPANLDALELWFDSCKSKLIDAA